MVDRILLGDHPSFGMGAFISQLGVNVQTANKWQMAWSTLMESFQIVSSGSVVIPDGTAFSPVFTWPDLGYYPVVLGTHPPNRFLLDYVTTNSARFRNDPDNFNDDSGTCYYIVTRTVRP